MRYRKPQLDVLDEANRSIQDLFTKTDGGMDGIGGGMGNLQPNPAYDLDE
jgi:hypothetical protein